MPSAVSEITIQPYDLPDAELLNPHPVRGRCITFIPLRVLVVIGKGSDPEKELKLEAIAQDDVPVLRRASGGCAVVLSPDMLAVSFALYGSDQPKSSTFFSDGNGFILRALAGLGVDDVVHAGTSDLARQGRKIAGTAIYRNRALVFYHAIINVAGAGDLISRYLKPPPRMPEYRSGRDHRDFVTSLAAEGFTIPLNVLTGAIRSEFERYIRPSGNNQY
jgi:lipoate---protein ligase